jgi:tetrapyrrole methylase family protein/MazG family protein
MAQLRSPEGCPWDREQNHRSLRHCLLEEAYEVLEAIDADDPEALREELGDVLLQVVFHAQLASEAGRFTVADVITGLREKLLARHPHVFGSASVDTATEVLEQWDRLKRRERGIAHSSIAEPPITQPALSRAQVIQRRAARLVGERTVRDARAALDAALLDLLPDRAEGRAAEDAIGELLFAAVGLARALGVDAEQALRERVSRFVAELQKREAPGAG